MDSNSRTKRRGFTKSKLVMSLYRAAKPSTTKPPPPLKPIPTNSIEFKANHQVFPQPTPNNKVAFVVTTERNRDSYYGKLESFYSGGGAEDEAVDAKAARYISSVQERFRLERVNSERNNINNYEQIIHL